MATLESKNLKKTEKNTLFQEYGWFYSNVYSKVQKAVDEFFQKDFSLRFMGISIDDNIFFYGDEYFVNKVPVVKDSGVSVRISSTLVSSLLDNTLGVNNKSFHLKNLTDIEARLIKSFTVFVYKGVSDYLNKNEVNQKVISSSKDYSFTFFVQDKNKHKGKIILSIPEFMLPEIPRNEKVENFGISDFKDSYAELTLSVGSTKLALNDIKEIEDGDIILLENSNINEMSVLWEENKVNFRINPNPSLIISVDNNGGNEMEEETSVKSPNMWDSILVDVVAEFDNVKLTLGELKQISEGLVIDVGSVYENKIKLRVENQVVATGELVILNDRYGVRIDNVKKTKEAPKQSQEAKKVAAPAAKATAPAAKKVAAKPTAGAKPAEGDENFDYSDFEIEDESI